MDQLLKSMDFDFWASGESKISAEKFFSMWKEGKAIMVDVRDEKETALIPLEKFGINIPINQLPDRLSELPEDKLLCLFCAGKLKAAMAYIYLKSKGVDNVKILAATLEEFVSFIKPGKIKKMGLE